MNITVLNGSPKGDISVTMQYIHFIAKKFPGHQLQIINISLRIKKLENNPGALSEVIDQIKRSDGVIWAFPLYYMLVHGNYKRFIELIFERNLRDAFKDKYTAALSTSIHFYDHTAHKYIHAVCDDLDMKYVDFFSAEMEDLLNKEGQEKLSLFAQNFFDAVSHQLPTEKRFYPVTAPSFTYVPGAAPQALDFGEKKIVVVTDQLEPDSNMDKMIARFRGAFAREPELINLAEISIKGGCLGCLRCAYDNTCVWEGKDDYIDFFKTKLVPADIIVFAGTIRDRFLSSTWKTFFDRSFFNTHKPALMHKQFGFLISGSLSQNENLREILSAYLEFQHSNSAGMVSDESRNSRQIDALIQSLAERSVQYVEKNYSKPVTFLGISGMKLFRDDIYSKLRMVFQADHRFYKKHRYYDFPQKNYKLRVLNTLGWLLLKIPPFRKRFYTRELKPGMIRNYQRIFAQMEK
jgi:multimeric flavodoxin WrbA